MTLDRIEVMGRSLDLDEGVKARLADPFWLLGRQWQVGEFKGDDAGRPVSVEVRAEIAGVSSFRAGSVRRDVTWTGGGPPLEALAEATAPAENGFSGLFRSARIGAALLDRLEAGGFADIAATLRETSRFVEPADEPALAGRQAAALRLLRRRAIDGSRNLPAKGGPAETAVSAIADRTRRKRAKAILKAWREEFDYGASGAWTQARMEYGFSLSALTPEGEVVLNAREHTGGDLDWHRFDIGGRRHRPRGATGEVETVTRRVLPTPVAYAGMPAQRWWEIEDSAVHMGDIQSGPNDFARLMVAEFATSYADDWFLVPLRVPRGALVRVTGLTVHDTFGATHGSPPTEVHHAAVLDTCLRDAAGNRRPRSFRLFEMAEDPGPDQFDPPWLFVAPVLGSSLHGPAIEKVEFARDEGANLAWAIERQVEGPLGRAFDRARGAGEGATAPAATGAENGGAWHYRLAQDLPPPWWIPFLPERVAVGSKETRLRRGRMRQWDEIPGQATGAFGSLLAPRDAPVYVEEEEVPRSGATVVRRWRFARGSDGSAALWLEHAKSAGRGERSSGLAWDVLDRGR